MDDGRDDESRGVLGTRGGMGGCTVIQGDERQVETGGKVKKR